MNRKCGWCRSHDPTEFCERHPSESVFSWSENEDEGTVRSARVLVTIARSTLLDRTGTKIPQKQDLSGPTRDQADFSGRDA